MLNIFGCCCRNNNPSDKFQQMYTCINHQGWALPSQQRINQLLNSLKGGNRQVKKAQAEAVIFNHLQLCKLKSQITFLLKNLLITDRVVDQLLLIDKISKYQLQFKFIHEKISNQPLDKIKHKLHLIVQNYFLYIKRKVSIYCQFKEIVGNNYQSTHPPCVTLIKLIESSLQLDQYVMRINRAYKSLNYFYKQSHLLQGIMINILKNQLKFYRIMMVAFYHLLQYRDSFENNPQKINSVKKILMNFNNHFVKNSQEILRDNSKIQGFQNITQIQEIPNDYVKLFNDLILGDVPPIIKYDSLDQQDAIVETVRQNSNPINIDELKIFEQAQFYFKEKANKKEQSTIQNQLSSNNFEENPRINHEQYYNSERSSDSTDHQKNKSKSSIKYSIKQNQQSNEDQQKINDPQLLKSFQLCINLSKNNRI